jgi:anti-sigma regulatory factor (Ser/Thr protein kinase)
VVVPQAYDEGSRWLWLPPVRTSPREARELVRAVCTSWGVDEAIASDALIVVTVLVTNVVVHARTPCIVRVARAGTDLRIDVSDECPHPLPIPGRGPVDLAGPRAVGMRLVNRLAAAWGVTDRAPGKAVWAVLRTDSTAPA